MNYQQVVDRLEALANPEKILLKERKFGIYAENSLGVYQKDITLLAREIGRNNELALELYASGIYEARLLCCKIFDPAILRAEQMDAWAAEFENWEICDSFCMGFFARSPHALSKAMEWSRDEREFVKRAGFVIMAVYGIANKNAGNEVFSGFFAPIEREVNDARIYVKKAVNWALRNIGKRNIDLQKEAIEVAERILLVDSKSAKWIAADALRELRKPGVSMSDYPRHIYRP